MHSDHATPPLATMFEMLTGYRLAAALAAMAKLDLADLLADGPRDVVDLAERAGAQRTVAGATPALPCRVRRCPRDWPQSV